MWFIPYWIKTTHSSWMSKIQQVLEFKKRYPISFFTFSTIQSKCFCVHLISVTNCSSLLILSSFSFFFFSFLISFSCCFHLNVCSYEVATTVYLCTPCNKLLIQKKIKKWYYIWLLQTITHLLHITYSTHTL